MGYGGGGGGGGGSGGSGGSGGGSGYRRVGEDRTANLKVDNITNRTGSNGTEVDGVVEAKGTHFVPPSGTTSERGSYGRAVIAGGVDPSAVLNTMQYVTIATAGDASDFGDLSYITSSMNACASSTRGLFASGFRGTVPLNVGDNTINYISIQSTGNAFDFGDLTEAYGRGFGLSNNTRGIFGGGELLPGPTIINTIDFVTIASTGNAAVFGDMAPNAGRGARGAASSTRGIISGGSDPAGVNTIEYITIATTGDAQDFGNLTTEVRLNHGSISNSTRALFGGGEAPGNTNVIDYVTIASLGNALNFGDLTIARDDMAAASTQTRGIFAGGAPQTDRIDFVTIATTGDATDFGNLLAATDRNSGGLSDSHGGLG